MSDTILQFFNRYDRFEGSTRVWIYECRKCENIPKIPAWSFTVPRKGIDLVSDDTLLNLGMHLQSHKKTDIQQAEANSNPTYETDPRFDAVLAQIKKLHDAKSQDYGSKTDSLANVRASQDFGIPPWIGALIRQNDKLTRIKNSIAGNNLVFESVEDSLLDSAVYAIIACVLYKEEQNETS